MRVLTSELLGTATSLQSRMLEGNHVLAEAGEVDSGMHRVFSKDRVHLLSMIRQDETDQLMQITGGLLPEDLAFTPEATEIKLYRAGVRKGLPTLERRARDEGSSLEQVVVEEEARQKQVTSALTLLKYDTEASRQRVESLLVKDHRTLDAMYLRLLRRHQRRNRK